MGTDDVVGKIADVARELVPLILWARKNGHDDIAVNLTRRHSELMRCATAIHNGAEPEQ